MVIPQWPPSPCVEDEEAALAREHDFNQPVQPPKSDNQPASSRGAVDQTPIILDADAKDLDSKSTTPIRRGRRPSDSQSSDDSLGPATPSATNSEQRFVYIPHPTSVPLPKEASKPATSTYDHDAEKPRGRPGVAPIQTNLGNDLEGMVTGRRRNPSPYSYHCEIPSANRQPSAASFLSPVTTASPQKALPTEARRAASAMPRIRGQESDSSTDSDRRPERRRHHSRLRSKRESFSRSNRPVIDDLPFSTKVSKPAPSLAQPRTDPGLFSKGLQDARTGHLSRGSQQSSRESPYTSAAEDSSKSKSSRPSPRDGLGSTRESPYTSSAEEAKSRHRHHHRGGLDDDTSSRSSVHLKKNPRVDTSTQHYSYGAGDLPDDRYETRTHRHNPKHHAVFDGRTYLEPTSAKSPEAMEDAFDKAFRANQAKVAGRTPRGSPTMSPYTSPPRTPPRTPRVERKSKDYFDLASPLSAQQQARSRPHSVEESQLAGLKPVTAAIAAASMGAASPKYVPTYTRSSTASLDTSSSGSMSKSTSGQRSRKPSPVCEELRPVSRSGSYAARDIQPLARQSTFPANSERPSSRSGSSIAPPFEPPRVLQRASSYTHANGSGSRPSSSYRTSQQNVAPGPPNGATLAPAALPKLVRSSPSSTTNIKSMASQPPLQNVLPPTCPRSLPSTGHSDWYTIKGIPQMDICPSCIGVLGNSRFRDHFLPSLAKPRNQAIHCSFSEPWFRLAWTQIHKQQKPTLEMLWHLAHRPPTTKPCPGQLPEVRSWYRIIDPTTLKPVQNFEACSECVRSVDIVFPQLKGIFERTVPGLLQEKSCNLNTKSKRFERYMTQLDKASTKVDSKKWRFSECIQDFVVYASRVSLVRECTRDNVMASQPWHFLPQLADFTICEECYAEVVWPLRDQVIARDVCKLLQLVPTKAGTLSNPPTNLHSCQLYSERMRQVFRESVQFDDFEYLEGQAKKRREVERLCQEKHKLLARDVAAGINRTEEMAKNLQVWKTWE